MEMSISRANGLKSNRDSKPPSPLTLPKEKFWAHLWNEAPSPPRFLPALVNSTLFMSKYISHRLLRYNKSLDEGSRPIPVHNSEYVIPRLIFMFMGPCIVNQSQ